MAESSGQEKTEEPTPRRREKAREQGNIPKSTDLSAAVLLVGGIILISHTTPEIAAALKEVMRTMLSLETMADQQVGNSLTLALSLSAMVGLSMLPLLVGLAIVAAGIAIYQAGLNFNVKKLAPKPSQISPLSGVKRLFSGGRGLMQLVFHVLKVLLVITLGYSAIHGRMGEIVHFARLTHEQVMYLAAILVYDVSLRIAVALLILALFDYAWQKYRNEQDMKMTKQEVRDEMKQNEGDPLMKQRRRDIALQRSRQRIQKDVPTATVIVTNPDHYSIALRYDSETMNAPRVVAKGVDQMALHIRRVAGEAGVPIVQRPPLARALYASCRVGDEVPEDLYKAVAEILAYVYELSHPRANSDATSGAGEMAGAGVGAGVGGGVGRGVGGGIGGGNR